MGEVKWTPQQKSAVEASGGSVVVSAAAGSGKTAVLVERVIRLLTNPEAPVAADRLLIVTFTNAAAAQMRERVTQSLSEMIAERGFDPFLYRQQILLSKAKISTIHSFCIDLLKENFEKLTLPYDFRIGDENEISVLKGSAMEQVLEQYYEQGTPGFLNLVELLSAGRNDKRLEATVERLYEFIRSHPFPMDWLNRMKNQYRLEDGGLAESVWGKQTFSLAEEILQESIADLDKATELIVQNPAMEKAYLSSFLAGKTDLEDVFSQMEARNWNQTRKLLEGFGFAKLSPLRDFEDESLKQQVTALRDTVKERIADLLRRQFYTTESGCCEDIRQVGQGVSTLFAVTEGFYQKVDELKSEKKLVDFSDLELFAVRLLTERDENGQVTKTALAKEVGARFDQIMIDEYQDVNQTQDLIFQMISPSGQNLFLVGDVKQSIYGFRQANPAIFLQKRSACIPYRPETPAFPAGITLFDNFRSRDTVTGFVNLLFDRLMTLETSGVSYNETERLNAAAVFPPDAQGFCRTEVEIIDMADHQADDTMAELEATLIGNRIEQMMRSDFTVTGSGQPHKPRFRDFCILLRVTSSNAAKYKDTLTKMGIPVWCDSIGGYFDLGDVSLILSLLRAIDNPLQDVSVAAVMMSPLFGFLPDEMAAIRSKASRGFLYRAVAEMAKENEKCGDFIRTMRRFTDWSRTLETDRLLESIYDYTGFFSGVALKKNGEVRQANLRLLVEYSRAYTDSGYRSLGGFLRFITRLQEQKGNLQAASALSENADVVRIMSIHRSKGLEFPVCFVAGCGKQFNTNDLRSPVLLHQEYGVGTKIRDINLRREYTTITREMIAAEKERENAQEELRVLYVALTRAKEKLILVMSLKDAGQQLMKIAREHDGEHDFTGYGFRKATSFAQWILPCLIHHRDGAPLREYCGVPNDISGPQESGFEAIVVKASEVNRAQMEPAEPVKEERMPDPVLAGRLREILDFTYPFAVLEQVPAKLSVSEYTGHEGGQSVLNRPSFLSEQSMSGAERGTALHTFMQFASYESAARDAEAEVKRLVSKGFLSAAQGDVVRVDVVKRFFEGPLYRRICQAGRVYREFKFSYEMPAAEYLARQAVGLSVPEKTPEFVVIQGVADCVLLEGEELTVIDYKTDYVSDMEQLRQRYQGQLSLYARALQEIFHPANCHAVLYSFHLSQFIQII